MQRLVSLFRPASVLLLLVGSLVCQFPCTAGSVHPPAFLITCPCNNGWGDFGIYMAGQGRIGTVQRFDTGCIASVVNFFCIGTQSLAPTPIPQGILVCAPTLLNVPSLNIDPILVYSFFGAQPGGTVYWLMIPNDPQLVGVTIAAQSFNQTWGSGSVPFNASPLLGLTIQQ